MPDPLPFRFDQLPAEMTAVRRWVCWNYEERKGKRTKVPYNPLTGELAASTRAATWGEFDAAVEGITRYGLTGVGFVLGDGWVGVDIDHAVTAGVPSDTVRSVCGRLRSYTELSPSGEGVHVIVQGELPGSGRKKNDIEMYGAGRYFTCTGWRLDEYGPAAVASPSLPLLYAELFPPPKPPPLVNRNLGGLVPGGERRPRADYPAGSWEPPTHLGDDELLRRIQASRSGAKFWHLYSGGWQQFYGSASEADAALVSILEFWTGGDAERMDRLFRQSALMRPKWDEKRGERTYGERTIALILSGLSGLN